MRSYDLKPSSSAPNGSLSVALACLVLLALSVANAQTANAQSAGQRTKIPRIILTDDMGTITGWATPPTRQDIEGWVAGYAQQGIDVVSWDLIGGQLASYKSKVCEPFPEALGKGADNVRHLIETGVDVPAVIAEASHRHGLQYWPAVRMNASATYPSRTHEVHPEWFLTSIGDFRTKLNYELPEVRNFMMRAFRELVEDYDADGLLLNFVRYPELFHPDRDIQNADLLTRYIGDVRKMLDEVGSRKGKPRLPLAVQVLARPNDGLRYGHDVRAWIRNGSVDYVLPSRSNNTDCNLPVRQWVEMANRTSCRILPTIHPNFRFPWTVENRATLESLRGTAHLYYRQGADGLSTMNMFDALQNRWFEELRDPAIVARGPHHYRYTMKPISSGAEALAMQLLTTWWRRSVPIYIADDPVKVAKGTLRITIENVGKKDDFEFTLNGDVIPKLKLGGGRVDYPRYSTAQANTFRFELPASELRLVPGENLVSFRLTAGGTDPEIVQGRVAVREVELLVPAQ